MFLSATSNRQPARWRGPAVLSRRRWNLVALLEVARKDMSTALSEKLTLAEDLSIPATLKRFERGKKGEGVDSLGKLFLIYIFEKLT
jgi:hypothetical protein